MYKSTSRNLASRSFRSAMAAKPKRISLRQTPKIIAAKHSEKKARALMSEPELVVVLGVGPQFIRKVYRCYRRHFEDLSHNPKLCSAYLNLLAGTRMLDGSLWTDTAVESMFRRAMPKGNKRKCSKKSS
jgi:hypothetical protein